MKSPHYKVLGLMPKGQSQYSIDVYESETHTWKHYAKRQIIYYCQFQKNDVYWTDGFYFIKPGGKSYYLCLQEIEEPDDNYLYVFELNRSDRSWFMKYHVDLSPIADIFAAGNYRLVSTVLGIVRGDRDEDSMFLFHEPGKIILYRFHDDTFEVLVDFRRDDYYEEGRFQFGFNDSYQFIETLAPA
ncbi:hypothetical protein BUALT_Bualt12G0054600 [Buddleja alternifolia]|uniref:Uncharacterized protein n=1 Tax=Buddleja alternifolia TaxID=168488 RepID=A0AAV6WV52_9LAMI|nr:hypothetical protein BUALT_Bualt12G0054600 [Buddleja alternifolia]